MLDLFRSLLAVLQSLLFDDEERKSAPPHTEKRPTLPTDGKPQPTTDPAPKKPPADSVRVRDPKPEYPEPSPVVRVANTLELHSAPAQAGLGTQVPVAPGNYKGFTIERSGIGGRPVAVHAEEPQRTAIFGAVRVSANYVTLHGIAMRCDDNLVLGNVFLGWKDGSAIMLRPGTGTQDIRGGPAAPGTVPWDGRYDTPVARRSKVVGNRIDGQGHLAVGKPETRAKEKLPAVDNVIEAHEGAVVTRHGYRWAARTDDSYLEERTSFHSEPSVEYRTASGPIDRRLVGVDATPEP